MGRSALIGGHGSTSSSSSSSSIGHETNNNNNYHFNSRDLTTDLNLGLTISPASQSHQQHHDFINPASFFPRDNELMQSSASDHNYSTINPYNQMVGAGEGSDQQQYDQNYSNSNSNGNSRLYVKVYMEGHPIGRKLDMLAHSGYHDLITTLDHMFNTNILWGAEVDAEKCEEFHVLTYEDEEGDWLMVGDVPWEMFLSAVKRLKISRACPC